MMRKISAILAAALVAGATLAPAAEARDGRRDGYSRHCYDRDYDRDRRHWRHYDRDYDRGRRHRDNDDDELAAGVVGLVLGLALGSLAAQPSQPRARCYDSYQRCGGAPPRSDYYERDSRYYDNRGGAYERDYGLDGGGYYEDDRPQCVRRERQWDRYANRYVIVDVPC